MYWLADPLIRVARRWQVPIVIVSGRISGRRLILEFDVAPVSADVAEVTQMVAAGLQRAT